MPFYFKQGETPKKRHTVFINPNGDKYYEELVSREGFSSIYSNLYHLHRPTKVKQVGQLEKQPLIHSAKKHRHRHIYTDKIKSIGEKNSYGVVREYIGHGIGFEMHEDPQIPNYGEKGKGLKLKEGMAICIEPMFNLGSEETYTEGDNWTVKTKDGSLSAHFEHTIGLTPNGVEVFT